MTTVRYALLLQPFVGALVAVHLESLRTHYSFSALKGIDWDDLGSRYRPAAESAGSIESFVAVIREMLAELKDLHATRIEERGVQPDIKLDHRGTGDPTFEEAVKILERRTRGR